MRKHPLAGPHDELGRMRKSVDDLRALDFSGPLVLLVSEAEARTAVDVVEERGLEWSVYSSPWQRPGVVTLFEAADFVALVEAAAPGVFVNHCGLLPEEMNDE